MVVAKTIYPVTANIVFLVWFSIYIFYRYLDKLNLLYKQLHAFGFVHVSFSPLIRGEELAAKSVSLSFW